MAVDKKQQDEARKKTEKFLKDKRYEKGVEFLYDNPDVSGDNVPFENFVETPEGWVHKNWKKLDDTFVMNDEPEGEE